MNNVHQSASPSFGETLAAHGTNLSRTELGILQVNLGKRCNQACHHCHVEAGPRRTEMMSVETAERVLELLERAASVHTLDITGGAPELNPQFRRLVRQGRALGRKVIDRCNLTVLLEPGQENTAEFLAQHSVTVVASLPCYSKANVERQRGLGVFEKSIEALQRLNALGFGVPASGLELNLVYNPVGATLPPPQGPLESDYRRALGEEFGIVFNHLYTLTNMPISRFLHQLIRNGQLQRYMDMLVQAFNPAATTALMCRELVSVSWDGVCHDCDFNQMLGIPLGDSQRTLWDVENLAELASGPIAIADHCYGCTAGAGSSCSGALTANIGRRQALR
jgi:radical SAM/Cys-rich protein